MTAPGTQLFTYLSTGKESTAGTSVATTRQWYGQGSGELDIDDMLALHRGNRGTRTNLAYATSKGTMSHIAYQSDTDIGAGYNELIFALTQLKGGMSAVGASADKTWTCAPSQTGANAQETYTIEVGDDVQEYEVPNCGATDFTISASRDGLTELSINWVGRKAVKSTKTTLAANTDVRIPGKLWIPRWATAQSGLAGASDTLNFLQDWSVTHQTGLVARMYQDGREDFGQLVEALPQTAVVTFHVESTAFAVSEFMDKKRAKTVDFMQLSATGPALGGSNYSAQLQYALLYTDVKAIASVDEGVNLYEIAAETVIDPTWATNFGGVIVGSLTALTA